MRAASAGTSSGAGRGFGASMIGVDSAARAKRTVPVGGSSGTRSPAGKGLDTASGTATPSTTTPESAAVVIKTTRVIRSAGPVASPARITPSQVCASDDVSDVPKSPAARRCDPLRTLVFDPDFPELL